MDTAAVMPRTDDNEIIAYKDSTYELVSKVASTTILMTVIRS